VGVDIGGRHKIKKYELMDASEVGSFV
jgi:hypothetical protein